jgi:hypothetical protein
MPGQSSGEWQFRKIAIKCFYIGLVGFPLIVASLIFFVAFPPVPKGAKSL